MKTTADGPDASPGDGACAPVLDDFAHHPAAVATTIDGARHAYPGRRLWAVFAGGPEPL